MCNFCPESGGVCVACGRVDAVRKQRFALVVVIACIVAGFVLVATCVTLSRLDR